MEDMSDMFMFTWALNKRLEFIDTWIRVLAHDGLRRLDVGDYVY